MSKSLQVTNGLFACGYSGLSEYYLAFLWYRRKEQPVQINLFHSQQYHLLKGKRLSIIAASTFHSSLLLC